MTFEYRRLLQKAHQPRRKSAPGLTPPHWGMPSRQHFICFQNNIQKIGPSADAALPRPQARVVGLRLGQDDAAVEINRQGVELDGHLPIEDWSKQLKGEHEDGMKEFFKALAVREMRTFGIILGARQSIKRILLAKDERVGFQLAA
jgi:hypothetical protein